MSKAGTLDKALHRLVVIFVLNLFGLLGGVLALDEGLAIEFAHVFEQPGVDDAVLVQHPDENALQARIAGQVTPNMKAGHRVFDPFVTAR